VSDFIRVLNLIKTRRNDAWLTASQQEAFSMLREALRIPCTVNLFGSIGVGKTFLAWILSDELGYTYFPHVDLLEQVEDLHTAGVILDNCLPARQVHRNVLKTLSFSNVSHAVLITRQMIRDYTHCVELVLTPTDQVKVRDNLIGLGFLQMISEAPNLWHLVNPHL
jgi:hypothetical protein